MHTRRSILPLLRPYLAATLIIAAASTARADVQGYDGKVELVPARGELRADMTLVIAAGARPLAEATLYLNSGMRVEAFECAACSGYAFDPSKTNVFQFAPTAAAFVVTFTRPLEPGHVATVHVRYGGKVVESPWGVNSLTDEWVELGLYTAWFPFDPDARAFHHRLDVTIDPRFTLVANGEVTGKPGRWQVSEPEPTSDLVLIAAPDLKMRTIDSAGARIVVGARGFDDAVVDRFVLVAGRMIDAFAGWFGRPDLHRVTFAMHRRERGGGYSRPRFVSMPLPSGKVDAAEERWIAHELAHFWWSGAPVATWEDWLNESFAEYSAWMYLREARGPGAVDGLVAQAQKRAAGKPPIWGLARDAEVAHDVLYRKGPLCLRDLEGAIGREAFTAFLRRLQTDHVRSTAAMLDRLEAGTSAAVRASLERDLRK